MKCLLFSGGPLDGQQLMVPNDDLKEYKFKKLKGPGFLQTGVVETIDCFYYQTSLKVRDCEIFVWQGDLFPPTPPLP